MAPYDVRRPETSVQTTRPISFEDKLETFFQHRQRGKTARKPWKNGLGSSDANKNGRRDDEVNTRGGCECSNDCPLFLQPRQLKQAGTGMKTH